MSTKKHNPSRKKPDRKANRSHPPRTGHAMRPAGASGLWLYGIHACLAALGNPKRQIHNILVTSHSADLIADKLTPERPTPQVVDRAHLESVLPADSVHQGLALLCNPLPNPNLADLIAGTADNSTLLVLDQANDPRNIGSVLRSAAAFGADAVVVPDRGTPESTGAMAKAAAGALETMPFVRVTNLARALRSLKDAGYWCVGLDGRAHQTLAETEMTGRTAIVMGAEGSGLRQLTAETCDYLAKIPISGQMESLNLSIAASIALYEINRTKSK